MGASLRVTLRRMLEVFSSVDEGGPPTPEAAPYSLLRVEHRRRPDAGIKALRPLRGRAPREP